jgi:hypothetical protein
MKRFLALALLAVAPALANPPTAVDEDFGGSQFPPSGWTVDGESRTWSWEDGGGYAKGVAECGAAPDSGWTALYSPPFRVNKGTTLRVQFRYRTYCVEYETRYVRIGTWRKFMGWGQEWMDFDEATTAFEVGGEYQAEFVLSVAGGSYAIWAEFDVDDVVITRQNVGVDPTSLGRVRALFR